MDTLRPRLLDEIEAFFENYNALNGKDFRPTDRSGPKKARKLLDDGADAYGKKNRSATALQAA